MNVIQCMAVIALKFQTTCGVREQQYALHYIRTPYRYLSICKVCHSI